MRRMAYAQGPCAAPAGSARASGGIIEGNDTRSSEEGDGNAVQ